MHNQQHLMTTFGKILEHLDIKPDDISIDDIYQKRTNNDTAPIIIKFNNYKNKLDFLQTAKLVTSRKQIFANQIGFNTQTRNLLLCTS